MGNFKSTLIGDKTVNSFNFSDAALSRGVSSGEREILPGYEFIPSSSQAAYFIKNLPEANLGDWIIAFNNDVVVGARKWMGDVIDVPVMGADGEEYSAGYMTTGQVPSFVVFDASENSYYSAVVSEDFGWVNNEIFVLDFINVYSDCYGDPGGAAYLDDCGVCSGGNSGHEANSDR